MVIINYKWILCPVCGNKTRLKIREDTGEHEKPR
ncbi:cysteine-rich KTR domain-containing protein, partial [Escherichia coli]